ncbi:TlpA family protein disulfide reductase [Pedobacter frigiditerrae]|uniref:TlpA family protein disulfide reductase n=1 Tax=Pedobacter frigiditerrae TaxID=2530452 RepID=A0A4R0MPC5_9SPHI|nr:TlpA disulfide reductase family protein [Pedobacter frigiditerrae]TCC88650.1 TlpA family protein disulfide reductase [Pedobacter frigiditerrae]
MKIIKQITCLSAFMLLGFAAMATEGNPARPVFHGLIKLDKGASPVDSLLIHLYRPNSIIYDPQVIWVVPGPEGNFEFKLPYFSKPSSIAVQAAHRNGKFVKLDKYFVEPGDDIRVVITCDSAGDHASFNGKGAEKYNVVRDLQEFQQGLAEVPIKLGLHQPSDIESKLTLLDGIMRNALERKRKILEFHKLGPIMMKLIDYEYANLFSKWDYWLYNMWRKPWIEVGSNRILLRKYFNLRESEFSYRPNPLMTLCPIYIINLSGRVKFELIFNGDRNGTSLQACYDRIKSVYPQPIKSQLLAWLLVNPLGLGLLEFNRGELDSLMVDAQRLVEIPFLRNEISNILKLSKGKQLFEASFSDLKGNRITTSSLKGKVVLIDMWGVGCGNCAVFHDMFEKQIRPKIGNRDDFVVLSISTDRNREKWIEGINSGLYTSKHDLNVFTDGLMFGHPFPKYYNLSYSPFILLVGKDGKVFSRLKGEPGPEAILKTINEALAEN